MSWWAMDIAAYALSRPRWLRAPCDLDATEVVDWVRRTRLSWVAGSADLTVDVPWSDLGRHASDVGLVEQLLRVAATEALTETAAGFALRGGAAGLTARQRLPLTTLTQFTGGVPTVIDSSRLADTLVDGCADGHVHQGASLPLELMVHWVAGAAASLGYLSEAESRRSSWTCIDDGEIHPEPLLTLLHLIRVDNAPDLNLAELTALGLAAARGDESSWYDLRRVPMIDDGVELLTVEGLQNLKRIWFAESPHRWLAILRIESIIHGCLTQRVPGLDVFATLFEQLATMRRTRSVPGSKPRYFQRAIEQHALATPTLDALELRLGDLALTGSRGDGMRRLRRDVGDALLGYQSHLRAAERPIRVTFPLGLIRTSPSACDTWRFDASDLYRLIEDAIELFEGDPELPRFVDGVDVCGREEDAPAWLFRPAFEHLAAWGRKNQQPLAFRCHAGEWFHHPVQGLRSVDDFLAMNIAPGRRIGHALALQSSAWDRLGEEPLIELFDDLVWAMATLVGRPDHDADIVRTLEERCRLLLPIAFPRLTVELPQGAGFAALMWRAYEARSETKTLVRLGYLEWVGNRLRFSGASPSAGREPFERLARAALSHKDVCTKAVARCGIDVASTRSLLHDCYEQLRDQVVLRIKRLGAVVEVCPTSNVLTGGVRGYGNLPLSLLLERGVRVTVNSDDPSLFHSFLQDEVRHVLPQLKDAAPAVIAQGRELVGAGLARASLREDLDSIVDRFCR